MKITLVKASILAAVLALASGCATTEQINAIKATADQALSTANSASSAADRALSTANQALDAARDAQASADAAQACCKANTDKIDRMFEKAMRK